VWCNDVALGGDYMVHYDVHILDAVVWALGKTPVAALGASAAFRPSVHGDARDSSPSFIFSTMAQCGATRASRRLPRFGLRPGG
jgi:predicted dehydrogenase